MKKNPKLFGCIFWFSLFTFYFTSLQCSEKEGGNPVLKALPKAPEVKKRTTIELESLENLISLTEQNLKDLLNLKASIFEYQKQQNLFLDHPNNKELLLKTGKAAKKVLETIKEQHLTHVFDAKFLSELSLFEKMVKKPTLPKN